MKNIFLILTLLSFASTTTATEKKYSFQKYNVSGRIVTVGISDSAKRIMTPYEVKRLYSLSGKTSQLSNKASCVLYDYKVLSGRHRFSTDVFFSGSCQGYPSSGSTPSGELNNAQNLFLAGLIRLIGKY